MDTKGKLGELEVRLTGLEGTVKEVNQKLDGLAEARWARWQD